MIGTHWLFMVEIFLNRRAWRLPGDRMMMAEFMTYVTVAASVYLYWRNNWELTAVLELIGFIKPDVIDTYYERAISDTLQKYNIPREKY